jgi:2-hydroxy-3-oxopropionate reductase
VADSIKPGGTIVDMSSIKPAEAQDHAQKLALHGVHHIDAPASGGTVGAEQGTLAIMAGGDPDVFATVEAVLLTMGRPVHVGRPG